MDFAEQQRWSAAWEAANLPGHPLMVNVIAEWRRTPGTQLPTPEAACLAYKVDLDRKRADGIRPHATPDHMVRCWSQIVDDCRGETKAVTSKRQAIGNVRRFNDGIGAQPETKEE